MEGIGFLEGFWRMVLGWSPLGQGIFFVIVFSGICSLIIASQRYVAVWLHGWPPYNLWEDDDDDDDD